MSEFLRKVAADLERVTHRRQRTRADDEILVGRIAEDQLPELIIDGSNLTGTAKHLAKLFAQQSVLPVQRA
jgi:hypothetical protein